MVLDGDLAQGGIPSLHTSRSVAPSLISRIRSMTGGAPIDRAIDVRIIAALNEVTEAVLTSAGVDGVQDTIAGCAKRVADAEKAVFILVSDDDGRLDDGSIVVRGRHDVHPQDWWLPRLHALASKVLASGEVEQERHPVRAANLLCAPVRLSDRPVGVLAVMKSGRPFSNLHLAMVEVLASVAASAVESAVMAEEGRYFVVTGERERIARELHDGVVQSLFSVSLGLELCKKQMTHDPDAAARRLDDLQKQVEASMRELRRFIYDLRPIRLGELGLVEALRLWMRQVTAGTDVAGDVIVTGERVPLTAGQEKCLYRVAKESVANAVKHGHPARVEVRIEYSGDQVHLTVDDDGCGFEPAWLTGRRASHGIGLTSIRERVEEAGGRIAVRSGLGAGTTVQVAIPVAATGAA